MGSEAGLRSAESIVIVDIGVFATITAILFTGALFEDSIMAKAPKQITSIDELMASNLTIVECFEGVHNLNR